MRSLSIALMLVLPVALPVTAHAAWPLDGNPLCTAVNDQQFPTIVSDGAGGAIVTWSDARGGATKDIYAQRVSAAGIPQWTADGVAICTAAGDQWEPKLTTDGAGGAIVTWYDYRGGATSDIYAQRVDAAGIPQWTADGVAICTATTDQLPTGIVSDGAGGGIVTWHDLRSGANYDIYVQRVNAAGIPQWTADGLDICNAASNQTLPMIASDGAGGAIVTWQDTRGGGNNDIYAQRVSDLGVPQWTANGVVLCGLSAGQIDPTIVADGAGGAIVTWFDGRSGARGVYVQRVSDLGVPQWTADGVALKTATTNQATTPMIVSDGAGGAIVTWMDNRSVTSYDIYARRVSDLGVAQWAANGVALCTAADNQYFPKLVPDGAGGAIVTWSDARSGTISDIYAQRVSTLGVPQWTADGISLSTGVTDKISPMIESDGAGGAIVTFQDYRSGFSDIYAQHINASGEIPTAVSGPARGPALLVGQVYPNPFAASAWMDVELATPSAVRIDVFDVAGRRVRAMTLGNVTSQRVEFDGRDNANRLLPSGVYFYRVKAAGETITRKMVIAR